MSKSFVGLDCGDNSCRFATNKTGMRTNSGCRCRETIEEEGWNSGWNDGAVYALNEAIKQCDAEIRLCALEGGNSDSARQCKLRLEDLRRQFEQGTLTATQENK